MLGTIGASTLKIIYIHDTYGNKIKKASLIIVLWVTTTYISIEVECYLFQPLAINFIYLFIFKKILFHLQLSLFQNSTLGLAKQVEQAQ